MKKKEQSQYENVTCQRNDEQLNQLPIEDSVNDASNVEMVPREEGMTNGTDFAFGVSSHVESGRDCGDSSSQEQELISDCTGTGEAMVVEFNG